MPNPKNPGDRTKASRFRTAIKNGQKLQPVDALWLAEYEEKQRRPPPNGSASKNFGASRSGRTINFQMEEQAEAVGTGNAAVEAATAALVAKEEGQRLDALTIGAIDALKASAEINRQTALMLREDYGAIFDVLRERAEVLEHTHIEMLQTVRSHFIEATQLEGQLMQRDAEQKPEDQLLTMLMAKYLGVDPEKIPRPGPRPKPNGAPPRPPANGAPPK